jgi:hypothetical protein
MNVQEFAHGNPLLHDLAAEQQLLGACLLWPDAIDNAASLIEAHHFFEPIHSQIFEWVLDLRARGQRPSAPLLNAYLAGLGQIDIAGLPLRTYVARLAAEATTILNIPDFAKVVREFWERRQIRAVLESGLELVRAAPIEISAAQISAETIEQLDAIASGQIPANGSGCATILAMHSSAPCSRPWAVIGCSRIGRSSSLSKQWPRHAPQNHSAPQCENEEPLHPGILPRNIC